MLGMTPGVAPVLGPLSLRVVDKGRMLAFWQGMLGLDAVVRPDGLVALTPAGSDRPLLLLEVDPRATDPGPAASGLFHVALLLPDRPSLGRAYLALDAAGARPSVVGAADHAVSEAIYYTDPEGNGLELYRDRPRDEWRRVRRAGGGEEVRMGTDPLDLAGMLRESGEPEPGAPAVAPGTVLGHVHLQVADLAPTADFYRDRLGMDVTVSSYPGARFLSWAGYHHHLGLNVWGPRPRTRPPAGARGLIGWALCVPGSSGEEERTLEDPDGVTIQILGGG